jgi:hypothetical protein
VDLCYIESRFRVHDFYCNILDSGTHLINITHLGSGTNSMQVKSRFLEVISSCRSSYGQVQCSEVLQL